MRDKEIRGEKGGRERGERVGEIGVDNNTHDLVYDMIQFEG